MIFKRRTIKRAKGRVSKIYVCCANAGVTILFIGRAGRVAICFIKEMIYY